MKSLTAQ
uniref:Uncharacterized protein n=1 Tax=Oryza glumipatula TaxID=40148 RepID=A0A1Y8Z5I1_9ORYZ